MTKIIKQEQGIPIDNVIIKIKVTTFGDSLSTGVGINNYYSITWLYNMSI